MDKFDMIKMFKISSLLFVSTSIVSEYKSIKYYIKKYINKNN